MVMGMMLLVLAVLGRAVGDYNQSLCADIAINQLHYFVNEQEDNADIWMGSSNSLNVAITYNLCKQVEVYCSYQNAVLVASLVIIDNDNMTCTAYQQSNVTYYQGEDYNSGIKVTYLPVVSGSTQPSYTISYPCNPATEEYCPTV
jgi:hypothetical protein